MKKNATILIKIEKSYATNERHRSQIRMQFFRHGARTAVHPRHRGTLAHYSGACTAPSASRPLPSDLGPLSQKLLCKVRQTDRRRLSSWRRGSLAARWSLRTSWTETESRTETPTRIPTLTSNPSETETETWMTQWTTPKLTSIETDSMKTSS